MKNCNASSNQTTRLLLIACVSALAVALRVSLPQPGQADNVRPPRVPANIQVPPGNTAFLLGHAVGTQNYICRPSSTSISGVAFTLFTPQATLFTDNNKEVTTHFFSPNPFESNADPTVVADGMIRATWQHSHDTSTVWGEVKPGHSSSDSAFVAQGSIPWLLITVVGAQDGPIGSGKLTGTTFIQRLNTSGGVVPSIGCASLSDLGNRAFVPYTADYFFYRPTAENKISARGLWRVQALSSIRPSSQPRNSSVSVEHGALSRRRSRALGNGSASEINAFNGRNRWNSSWRTGGPDTAELLKGYAHARTISTDQAPRMLEIQGEIVMPSRVQL